MQISKDWGTNREERGAFKSHSVATTHVSIKFLICLLALPIFT